MGWVCPTCCTNNEDDASQCMVCDTARGAYESNDGVHTRRLQAIDALRGREEVQEDTTSKRLRTIEALRGRAETHRDDSVTSREFEIGVALLKSSPQKGFSMLLSCASRGYAPAQSKVGDCYRDGIGVETDRQKALEWYRKAAEQGSEAAREAIKKLQGSD